jgi:hypothetical protein
VNTGCTHLSTSNYIMPQHQRHIALISDSIVIRHKTFGDPVPHPAPLHYPRRL